MNARYAQFLLRLGGLGILAGLLQLQGGCTYESSPQPPSGGDQAAASYDPPPAPVVTEYQQDLDPYGSWVTVAGYGQCWRPADRPDGWEPYTVGHWEYCDAGWTWVAESDEAQWGDICYHYGRWYRDPSQGWVWIPGTTWAPAWVAWREGNGYCGWAPLPPQAGFGPDVSVAAVDQYVPAQQFVYCSEQYVNSPRVDEHFVRNDTTIINQTTNITNITVVNDVVVNRGIAVNNVQRATGRPVEKVELARASSAEQARALAASGKPVVFAPLAVQQAAKEGPEKVRSAPAAAPQQAYVPPKPEAENRAAANPPAPAPAPERSAVNNPPVEERSAGEKAREDHQPTDAAKAKPEAPAPVQTEKPQPPAAPPAEKHREQPKQAPEPPLPPAGPSAPEPPRPGPAPAPPTAPKPPPKPPAPAPAPPTAPKPPPKAPTPAPAPPIAPKPPAKPPTPPPAPPSTPQNPQGQKGEKKSPPADAANEPQH